MSLKVLLIEDSATDARIFEDLVNESGEDIRIDWARSLTDAQSRAANGDGDGAAADVVVTDLGLPDSSGLDTAVRVLAAFPGRPVIVMTGLDDPQAGVQAVQQGCQDYVVKGICDPSLLVRTLRHAVERHAAERRVRESEERFRALVEMSPDAILMVGDGVVRFVNPSAVRLFAATRPDDLVDLPLSRLLAGADAAHLADLMESVSQPGATGRSLGEFRLEDRAGEPLDVEVSVAPVSVSGRAAAQVVLRDIGQRRAREREQRLAQAVFHTTAEAMMITDARTRIVAVNRAFSAITGYQPEDIVGQTPTVLASGRHDADFYADLWRSLGDTGHWRGEVWNRRADGAVYVQRLTISRICDVDGSVSNYVGVFSDITEEKAESARLAWTASHDALTGLPNRALLRDRLDRALSRMHRGRNGVAVLFVDLDGFKPVNDRHGHLAGDMLLQGVAERLQGCVRETDTVARIGGDEFVVLSTDAPDEAAAATVAAKVLDALAVPFDLGTAQARVGASIGIALAPRNGDDVDRLLDAADAAMYDAKRAGKGVWRLAPRRLEALAC